MRFLLILWIAWSLGTCRSAVPEAPNDFEWTTWSNTAVGYALEVPDVYRAQVEDDGRTVLFRWSGTVPVKVYITDLESARSRGLWAAEEPSGETSLAGLPAVRYDYVHCDGPFCSSIASWVAEKDGMWLALEFRSNHDLNSVNRQILRSFTILPAPAD